MNDASPPIALKARFARLATELEAPGCSDDRTSKLILQQRWQGAETEAGRAVSLEQAKAWAQQPEVAGHPVAQGLDAYYTCRGQIALHQAAIEQMQRDGLMVQNTVQGYWTPRTEFLDDYHAHMGVITLLRSLQRLGID